MSKARLDIASSSMNLTKALIDFPLSGSLAEAGQETYKWLIRERVDQASFNTCRDLAASLAYSNESGMVLQKRIDAADQQIVNQVKKAPLRLVVSGSPGRLIDRNPETLYIVTIVSTLTRYRDPKFRAPIKAVVSQIVQSVYVNAVNAGKTLPDLPGELLGLHQHLLDDKTFAGIVMGIQRAEGDVIIRSKRFLADLSHWIYFYFDGVFEVSVQNKVLLSSKLGDGAQFEKPNSIEASIATGGNLSTFLQGLDDAGSPSSSFQRQPFYQLGSLTPGPRGTRVQMLLNSVSHAAKVVLTWMLETPLAPLNSSGGLCFELDRRRADKNHVMGELFMRSPQLLQLETSEISPTGPIFRTQGNGNSLDSKENDEDWDYSPDDAVGGIDASGLSTVKEQVRSMITLFREIVQLDRIRWDSVFEVVASTVGGMDCSDQGHPTDDDGSSSWAANQYGSFVAAASWLDIAIDLIEIKPFALEILEGNMRGVPDEFGFVRCERMRFDSDTHFEKAKTHNDVASKANWQFAKDLDTVNADFYTAVFRTDTHLYRLMTTVQSGSYLRIVDPSVVVQSIRNVQTPRCIPKDLHDASEIDREANVRDFDYALGYWTSHQPASHGEYGIELSKTLDLPVKVNTLLAISLGECILRDIDQCCAKCAFEALDNQNFKCFERIMSYRRTGKSLARSRRRPANV
ncbi:MAG: hypothetical protein M1820_001587 [Bogoriella megaspora]|nr:MAG: hypothetical protein M1820_001587 [Bogoriella megaspora]